MPRTRGIKSFKGEISKIVLSSKNYQKLGENNPKSPQVVKHVVKGEKWACSTLKVGKNKPIIFVAKTRDFKRFSENHYIVKARICE